MEGIIKLLPIIAIAAIWIIKAVVEAKKRGEQQQQARDRGEDQPRKSGWSFLADAEEIKKFLQEGAPQERQQPRTGESPGARRKTRAPQSGPSGMPRGAVIPAAPRARSPLAPGGKVEPSTRRRAPRHVRQPAAPPPTAPAARRATYQPETRTRVEKSLDAHGLPAAGKSAFEEAVDRRAARTTKRFGANVAPGAEAKPKLTAAQQAASEQTARLPKLTRQSLRHAIIMREVLGPPLAIRGPIT